MKRLAAALIVALAAATPASAKATPKMVSRCSAVWPQAHEPHSVARCPLSAASLKRIQGGTAYVRLRTDFVPYSYMIYESELSIVACVHHGGQAVQWTTEINGAAGVAIIEFAAGDPSKCERTPNGRRAIIEVWA